MLQIILWNPEGNFHTDSDHNIEYPIIVLGVVLSTILPDLILMIMFGEFRDNYPVVPKQNLLILVSSISS